MYLTSVCPHWVHSWHTDQCCCDHSSGVLKELGRTGSSWLLTGGSRGVLLCCLIKNHAGGLVHQRWCATCSFAAVELCCCFAHVCCRYPDLCVTATPPAWAQVVLLSQLSVDIFSAKKTHHLNDISMAVWRIPTELGMRDKEDIENQRAVVP